jgi:zinc transport system permease protein
MDIIMLRQLVLRCRDLNLCHLLQKVPIMLDDFFVRALLAGLAVACVAGPLGCFVVWRKLAYFGDTMAHAALLGAVVSVFFSVPIVFAVFGVALAASLLVIALQERALLPTDAFLGLLSHGSLALGLLAVSFLSPQRIDLNGLLFGDILAVSRFDLLTIGATGLVVIGMLVFFWKPFLALAINRDIAIAEGVNAKQHDVVFMVILAALVAVAIKVVGALLITALLIIPAAAARRVSSTPLMMAGTAALAGAIAVVIGLLCSLQWDTPSGPSIVVCAVVLFAASLFLPRRKLPQEGQT